MIRAYSCVLSLVITMLLPVWSISQETDVMTDSGTLNELVCPFDLLKQAYLGLGDDSPQVLDVYAVELEVLLLCRERQDLLLTIARNDELLRKNMNIRERGVGPEPFTIPNFPPIQQAAMECPTPTIKEVEQSEGEVVDAELEVEEHESVNAGPGNEEVVTDFVPQESSIPQVGQIILDRCLPPLTYQLHSIMRTGANWKARLRIVNGEIITVSLRDKLPDGRIVTGIDRSGLVITDVNDNSELLSLPAAQTIPFDRSTANNDGLAIDTSAGREGMENPPAFGDGTMDVITPGGSN